MFAGVPDTPQNFMEKSVLQSIDNKLADLFLYFYEMSTQTRPFIRISSKFQKNHSRTLWTIISAINSSCNSSYVMGATFQIKRHFWDALSLRSSEADSGYGGAGGVRHPYFLQSFVFFCNHFEELQTVLFEVELIINNDH